jgi:hypothetical protein
MLPQFLMPESVIQQNGAGAPLLLGAAQGRLLQLTLSISRVVEQESLEVIVEGSEDGTNWLEKPLAHFSQKFYCGDYSMLCDLSGHPEVKQIRASWKVNRWGRGSLLPRFEAFLYVEEAKALATVAGV